MICLKKSLRRGEKRLDVARSKNTAILSAEKTGENITDLDQEKEGVSLKFVEANDIAEKAPPKVSKLKEVVKNAFLTEEDEEKQSKRKKTSRFFQKHCYLLVGLVVFLGSVLMPEAQEVFYVDDTAYQLFPTDKHLEAIFMPLARIADRHSKVSDINPDLSDVLTSITACIAYGMELKSVLVLKKHLDREKAHQEKLFNVPKVNAYARPNQEQREYDFVTNNDPIMPELRW